MLFALARFKQSSHTYHTLSIFYLDCKWKIFPFQISTRILIIFLVFMTNVAYAWLLSNYNNNGSEQWAVVVAATPPPYRLFLFIFTQVRITSDDTRLDWVRFFRKHPHNYNKNLSTFLFWFAFYLFSTNTLQSAVWYANEYYYLWHWTE